jgi:hypothetical protein
VIVFRENTEVGTGKGEKKNIIDVMLVMVVVVVVVFGSVLVGFKVSLILDG